jgi:glycosyltransferase involved in cell wall biosynthesis
MVIGLDLRSLPTDGSAGAGVAHAARFLADALIRRSVPWTWNLYIPKGVAPVGKNILPSQARHIELDHREGAALRVALKNHPCDLLIVLSGSIPPGLKVPTVPWIHDVAIFAHPEWFPQSWLKRTTTTFLFEHGVRKAPFILSASEATKNETSRFFDIDPEHIYVTHEGGDPFLETLHGSALQERKRLAKLRVAATGITNAFTLVLGTVEPRKNISFLMSAWRKACASIERPFDLVIAGRDGWKLADVHSALTRHIIPEKDGSRIHRLYAVDDDEKRDLLLAADLVTVPSLHEGFGLVALEGMQARTAVIASNAGALPEVVGEAGILLPATDQAAWVAALAGLVNDDISREEMAEAGKSRAAAFSWDQAAWKIEQVLRELYENHHTL